MLDKKNIINRLRTDQTKLKRDFHIKRMGLFGSFSRGAQSNTSDIDFIIELDSKTKDIYETKKQLRKYLRGLFHRDIDLAHYKYLKPYVKKRILDEVEPIV